MRGRYQEDRTFTSLFPELRALGDMLEPPFLRDKGRARVVPLGWAKFLICNDMLQIK